MFTNRPISILYLDRGFFLYYDTNKHEILQVDFSAFSSSVEIYKRDELENLISNFITQNKIAPGELYIILAESTLFLKGISQDTQDIDSEIKKFTDNIPFENVITKSYSIENGTLLISTNKDYFGIVARVFERNGFTFQAATPVFSIAVDLSSGFTQQVAQKIAGNIQPLKDNSFELHETPQVPKLIGFDVKKSEKKSQKTRLIVLLGIFGVLIVVLILVYFANQEVPPKPLKNTAPAQNQTTPTPFQQRTSQEIVVTKNPENLRIKIITTTQSISLADSIKSELEKNGFENVEEVLNNSSASNKTIITFSPQVTSDMRDKIGAAIQDASNVIIQENQLTDADISIALPSTN